MPDISKCNGIMCPIRDTCYRFTSIPDMFQAYSVFNYKYETESCEHYWENKQVKSNTTPCEKTQNTPMSNLSKNQKHELE